jgi:hypothetical protein
MRLEKPHLANFLGSDARGSDVGNRAGGKFQASVGGINSISEYWNSDGVQAGNFHGFAD